MHTSEHIYCAMLHSLPGLGHKMLEQIMTNYLDAQTAWEDMGQHWTNMFSLKDNLIYSWLDAKETMEFEKMLSYLTRHNIHICMQCDEGYPKRYEHIADAPVILYYKGDLSLCDAKNTLWVVGSRKMTKEYGARIVDTFMPDIVAGEMVVVSGGAYGIDAKSHESCIANNGKTIAIFGTGIDVVYPSSNKTLFENIVQTWWLLLSEFPLTTPGHSGNFPRRNRLVSGLSDGVLVVEAGEKSGTWITVGLALDQGKDVFVVPGDIFRTTSKWCNILLSKWVAKAVQCAQDIFDEYGIQISEKNENKKSAHNDATKNMSKNQKKIFTLINTKPKTSDEIAWELWLQMSELSAELMLMQLSWYIDQNDTQSWYPLIS